MRILFLLLISSAAWAQPAIFTAGKAKNVMQGIDLSPNISLDTIVGPGLYGVGPVDDLQGEVTIINGEVHVSEVVNGQINSYVSSQVKAPFFVYAYVELWEEVELEVNWQSLSDLQQTIEELAAERGWQAPFPFMIQGEMDFILYHIIMRDLNEKSHSHEAHQQSKVMFEDVASPYQLMGFFSRNHEGVFTHKGQYVHVHLFRESDGLNAHLDDVKRQGKVTLLVPLN